MGRGRETAVVAAETEIRAITSDERSPFERRWKEILDHIDLAFQAIVSVHSGRPAGLESFLRGFGNVGFRSISSFFDAAFADGVLPEVEVVLIEEALRHFAALPNRNDLKLFVNLDARSLLRVDSFVSSLTHTLSAQNVLPASLVVELSTRDRDLFTPGVADQVERLAHLGVKLALDDFGAGYASMPLLDRVTPEYVKIDPYFIATANKDGRKKVFLRHLVNVAHVMGVQVIAEGVETESEYYACKNAGCDMVQGYLIQRPDEKGAASIWSLDVVTKLNQNDRRHHQSDRRLVRAQIDTIEPIRNDADLSLVFDRFRQEQTNTFFPVVTPLGEPVGIVREQDLKGYAYSPFGKELLSNKGYGRQLADFLWRCPVADVNVKAEKILEIFSADDNSEGILMVQDGRYVGFLSARSLLRILNEKNLALARDQNPLTKLPGNSMINDYLAEALANHEASHLIAYVDFDNFKPFNDTYGFRQGDRAITLFAELLMKNLPRDGVFIGHIGGDDFFAAFRDFSFDEGRKQVAHVIDRFRSEVESFYDQDARDRGYILAKDRQGILRETPLLTASAALVHIPKGRAPGSIDDISTVIARMKSEAKLSPDKMAAASIL